MVVIAIIGVLVALVAAAVSKVIPAQQQRNTERTIQKLNGELQAHWRGVIDDAKYEFAHPNPTIAPAIASVKQLAGYDNERATILWVKLRCVQQFPMSYQEIVIGVPFIGADPTYKATLKAVGITNPPALSYNPLTIDGQKELGACLYIALTAKSHRGKTTQEDSFNSDERGTAPSGLPMIVDNWRQPLTFFRWPAGDPTFQSMKPSSAAFGDPLDPTGRLMDQTWNAANASTVEPAIKHRIRNLNGAQYSYYLSPVVVSAGQDGDLGIADLAGMSGYWMTPATAGTNDNIYSYLLK
jgi:hypothetical protein